MVGDGQPGRPRGRGDREVITGVVVARFCVSFFWLSAAAFDACFAIRASSARAMLNDSAAVSRVTGGVAWVGAVGAGGADACGTTGDFAVAAGGEIVRFR